MKPDLRLYLGQRVRVVVDRPLGSAHPRDPRLIYPVNYGELPDTLSGDGHPIDAYLLGWPQPLTEGRGTVVAVLVRADDHEDKLAVARDGTPWTAETVRQAVHFQEQYFQTTVVMARE
ncbi:inorganic diphosphatase [Deinococcus fonticola]|uniref:inorganic diphosphatase n=1 Tax=Deinococcus fonticola TaxID=2528713 RepID=UPI001075560C|nr:inorganic diphosphatase [Deinococcus fonticola]